MICKIVQFKSFSSEVQHWLSNYLSPKNKENSTMHLALVMFHSVRWLNIKIKFKIVMKKKILIAEYSYSET